MWTVGTIRDHVSVERTEDGVMVYVTEDGATSAILLTPREAAGMREALS